PQMPLGAAELDTFALKTGLRGVEVGADPAVGILQVQIDRVLDGAAILGEVSAADVVSGHGPVLPHEHVDGVNPMHKLVGQDAAAKITVVAEVEVLWWIPLTPAHRTKITVPVQISGLLFHAGRRGVTAATVAGWIGAASTAPIEPPRAHEVNLAEL